MFTPRQKRIIKYLSQQDDFTSLRSLAEMFNRMNMIYKLHTKNHCNSRTIILQ